MGVNNVRGENGFINIEGRYGVPSHMFTVSDPNFWENIEDKIVPLVKVLIKHKIETFGSCQGHYVEGQPELYANVRYYSDDRRMSTLVKRSIEVYNDSRVELSKEASVQCNTGERPTDRITFMANPKNREELDNLINGYSEFLDNFLDEKSKHRRT